MHLGSSSSTSARLWGFSWHRLGAAWLPQPPPAGHLVHSVCSEPTQGWFFNCLPKRSDSNYPNCAFLPQNSVESPAERRGAGAEQDGQPAAGNFSPGGAAWRAVHHSQPPVLRARPRTRPAVCRQPRGAAVSARRERSCARLCCGCSAAALPHGAARTPRHRRLISAPGFRCPSHSHAAVPRPLGLCWQDGCVPRAVMQDGGTLVLLGRMLGFEAFVPCGVWVMRCSLCTECSPAPTWQQQGMQGGTEQCFHVLELILAAMGSSRVQPEHSSRAAT